MVISLLDTERARLWVTSTSLEETPSAVTLTVAEREVKSVFSSAAAVIFAFPVPEAGVSESHSAPEEMVHSVFEMILNVSVL
jgi:hypothetical protein